MYIETLPQNVAPSVEKFYISNNTYIERHILTMKVGATFFDISNNFMDYKT